MMNLSFNLTDNTLLAKLATKKAIEKALTRVGDEAVTYASGLAPVDTGRLRGSIEKRVSMEGEHAVYVGTNVEYAIYQEFGTSKMSAANGGRGYLRPAISEHLQEYKEIISSNLKNIANW